MNVNLRSTDRAQRQKDRVKRPAKPADTYARTGSTAETGGKRVLIVDLNNFSTFPTLAIGTLVASLRNSGHQVRLMCPLAHDVPAVERERSETRLDDLKRRVHVSTSPALRYLRESAFRAYTWRMERSHPRVIAETRRELDKGYDVILLSAYLQHFNSVREIARLARARNVPVLLGGPMFNLAETAEVWRQIDGINAVVGAEVDLSVGDLVTSVCTGEDLLQFPGVVLPDGRRSQVAAPFRKLDDSPLPDFTDFPWDRYPVRIIPMMTGRGCQWDKCLFCSDVISASGRTFRTKSVETVLLEMQELSRRHETTNFLFLDLKLNSYPAMFRGISESIQSYVQGAEWVGTVHVDLRRDHGLSRADLNAAARGGMRRINFGLESGSQRLLDLMQKGCDVERNSEFIRHAHEAGLSVRCSMFRGFPGETAEDMQKTADFLEAHARYLDRVRFIDFKVPEGTPIARALAEKNELAGRLETQRKDARRARVDYFNPEGRDRAYRRAKSRALATIYAINRHPLRPSARQFDGLM